MQHICFYYIQLSKFIFPFSVCPLIVVYLEHYEADLVESRPFPDQKP